MFVNGLHDASLPTNEQQQLHVGSHCTIPIILAPVRNNAIVSAEENNKIAFMKCQANDPLLNSVERFDYKILRPSTSELTHNDGESRMQNKTTREENKAIMRSA